MNNKIFFDNKYIKFRCIQAFFYRELQRADEIKKQDGGKDCTRNSLIVLDELKNIMSIIEHNNNTYNTLKELSKRNAFIKNYYNSINRIIKKYFIIDEPWIPSLLTLETFRIYTESGFEDFRNIKFIDLIAEYEKHEDRKENKIGLHLKCAEELFLN